MYSKRQFANDLLKQLDSSPTPLKISRWAHRIYLDKGREFEPELLPVVMRLIAMEEGHEFEYPLSEIGKLADKLSS